MLVDEASPKVDGGGGGGGGGGGDDNSLVSLWVLVAVKLYKTFVEISTVPHNWQCVPLGTDDWVRARHTPCPTSGL